jgi:hypothetical protein
MASTKARKQTKSQPKMIHLLAVRNGRDGTRDFVSCITELKGGTNSQATLLKHICLNKWEHSPPVEYISQYLYGSQTYAILKAFGGPTEAFVMEFYESDLDRPNTYSCREIVSMSVEDFESLSDNIRSIIKDDGEKFRDYM